MTVNRLRFKYPHLTVDILAPYAKLYTLDDMMVHEHCIAEEIFDILVNNPSGIITIENPAYIDDIFRIYEDIIDPLFDNYVVDDVHFDHTGSLIVILSN